MPVQWPWVAFSLPAEVSNQPQPRNIALSPRVIAQMRIRVLGGGRSPGWKAFLGVAVLLLLSCSKEPTHTLQGIASWYGHAHHGRITASGRRFSMYEFTAAHRTLPLGTRLRVTNLSNGRAVIVTITDRGPFVSGRVIDLSFAAAQEIGMLGRGTAPVHLEILNWGER
jgi:rare lipoprotein A